MNRRSLLVMFVALIFAPPFFLPIFAVGQTTYTLPANLGGSTNTTVSGSLAQPPSSGASAGSAGATGAAGATAVGSAPKAELAPTKSGLKQPEQKKTTTPKKKCPAPSNKSTGGATKPASGNVATPNNQYCVPTSSEGYFDKQQLKTGEECENDKKVVYTQKYGKDCSYTSGNIKITAICSSEGKCEAQKCDGKDCTQEQLKNVNSSIGKLIPPEEAGLSKPATPSANETMANIKACHGDQQCIDNHTTKYYADGGDQKALQEKLVEARIASNDEKERAAYGKEIENMKSAGIQPEFRPISTNPFTSKPTGGLITSDQWPQKGIGNLDGGYTLTREPSKEFLAQGGRSILDGVMNQPSAYKPYISSQDIRSIAFDSTPISEQFVSGAPASAGPGSYDPRPTYTPNTAPQGYTPQFTGGDVQPPSQSFQPYTANTPTKTLLTKAADSATQFQKALTQSFKEFSGWVDNQRAIEAALPPAGSGEADIYAQKQRSDARQADFDALYSGQRGPDASGFVQSQLRAPDSPTQSFKEFSGWVDTQKARKAGGIAWGDVHTEKQKDPLEIYGYNPQVAPKTAHDVVEAQLREGQPTSPPASWLDQRKEELNTTLKYLTDWRDRTFGGGAQTAPAGESGGISEGMKNLIAKSGPVGVGAVGGVGVSPAAFGRQFMGPDRTFANLVTPDALEKWHPPMVPSFGTGGSESESPVFANKGTSPFALDRNASALTQGADLRGINPPGGESPSFSQKTIAASPTQSFDAFRRWVDTQEAREAAQRSVGGSEADQNQRIAARQEYFDKLYSGPSVKANTPSIVQLQGQPSTFGSTNSLNDLKAARLSAGGETPGLTINSPATDNGSILYKNQAPTLADAKLPSAERAATEVYQKYKTEFTGYQKKIDKADQAYRDAEFKKFTYDIHNGRMEFRPPLTEPQFTYGAREQDNLSRDRLDQLQATRDKASSDFDAYLASHKKNAEGKYIITSDADQKKFNDFKTEVANANAAYKEYAQKYTDSVNANVKEANTLRQKIIATQVQQGEARNNLAFAHDTLMNGDPVKRALYKIGEQDMRIRAALDKPVPPGATRQGQYEALTENNQSAWRIINMPDALAYAQYKNSISGRKLSPREQAIDAEVSAANAKLVAWAGGPDSSKAGSGSDNLFTFLNPSTYANKDPNFNSILRNFSSDKRTDFEKATAAFNEGIGKKQLSPAFERVIQAKLGENVNPVNAGLWRVQGDLARESSASFAKAANTNNPFLKAYDYTAGFIRGTAATMLDSGMSLARYPTFGTILPSPERQSRELLQSSATNAAGVADDVAVVAPVVAPLASRFFGPTKGSIAARDLDILNSNIRAAYGEPYGGTGIRPLEYKIGTRVVDAVSSGVSKVVNAVPQSLFGADAGTVISHWANEPGPLKPTNIFSKSVNVVANGVPETIAAGVSKFTDLNYAAKTAPRFQTFPTESGGLVLRNVGESRLSPVGQTTGFRSSINGVSFNAPIDKTPSAAELARITTPAERTFALARQERSLGQQSALPPREPIYLYNRGTNISFTPDGAVVRGPTTFLPKAPASPNALDLGSGPRVVAAEAPRVVSDLNTGVPREATRFPASVEADVRTPFLSDADFARIIKEQNLRYPGDLAADSTSLNRMAREINALDESRALPSASAVSAEIRPTPEQLFGYKPAPEPSVYILKRTCDHCLLDVDHTYTAVRANGADIGTIKGAEMSKTVTVAGDPTLNPFSLRAVGGDNPLRISINKSVDVTTAQSGGGTVGGSGAAVRHDKDRICSELC